MTNTVISSASKEVVIGFDQPFCVIGERINPTGRKALAAEAAALLSWIFIGPCAVPDRTTPGTAVSTGRNLGCTSKRKRSLPGATLNKSIRSGTGLGIMPTANTTRSTRTSISSPHVRLSFTVTEMGCSS